MTSKRPACPECGKEMQAGTFIMTFNSKWPHYHCYHGYGGRTYEYMLIDGELKPFEYSIERTPVGTLIYSYRGLPDDLRSALYDVSDAMHRISSEKQKVRGQWDGQRVQAFRAQLNALQEQGAVLMAAIEDLADEVEAYQFKKSTQRSPEWTGGANCWRRAA